MAASTVAIHVNGPALVFSGAGLFSATANLAAGYTSAEGSLDTPTWFGTTEDGVDIDLNYYDSPVMADTGGERIPVDLQDFGVDATIRGRFVIFDAAEVIKFRTRNSKYPADGQISAMGTVMASNLMTRRLIIKAIEANGTNSDGPWRFYNTIVRGPLPVKNGTKRTVWNATFYAWAVIGNAPTAAYNSLGPSDAGGGSIPLYDHLVT